MDRPTRATLRTIRDNVSDSLDLSRILDNLCTTMGVSRAHLSLFALPAAATTWVHKLTVPRCCISIRCWSVSSDDRVSPTVSISVESPRERVHPRLTSLFAHCFPPAVPQPNNLGRSPLKRPRTLISTQLPHHTSPHKILRRSSGRSRPTRVSFHVLTHPPLSTRRSSSTPTSTNNSRLLARRPRMTADAPTICSLGLPRVHYGLLSSADRSSSSSSSPAAGAVPVPSNLAHVRASNRGPSRMGSNVAAVRWALVVINIYTAPTATAAVQHIRLPVSDRRPALFPAPARLAASPVTSLTRLVDDRRVLDQLLVVRRQHVGVWPSNAWRRRAWLRFGTGLGTPTRVLNRQRPPLLDPRRRG